MVIHLLTCLALTAVTLHLFVLPAVDMARAAVSSQ